MGNKQGPGSRGSGKGKPLPNLSPPSPPLTRPTDTNTKSTTSSAPPAISVSDDSGGNGSGGPKGTWSWEDDSKGKGKGGSRFTVYDAETNDVIEAAYKRKEKGVKLTHGYFGSSGGYYIDFQKMTQVKSKTGFTRAIERSHIDPVTNKLKVSAKGSTPNGVKLNEKGLVQVDQDDLDRLINPEATGFTKPQDANIALCKRLTNWRTARPNEHDCPICLCEFDEKHIKLACKHEFHIDCIVHCLKGSYLVCPSCQVLYGVRTGTMPTGTMKVSRKSKGSESCDGYKDVGTIIVAYNFPSGIQTKEHPVPGMRYTGTSRTAYLPDNKEGQEVLALLQLAFDRKLTFRIGTSVTTGENNAVVWNGIHHKTGKTGGATKWGYPDAEYFSRVKEELAALGVTVDDLKKE
eukprot:TRINITY_DN7754_c0_g1_i1.p1 TRINITY_DN7754_c0_g1~~TRINITY_DN7754_c0_g1_i1.p1  ORF type:complete len:424 (-),score=74.79 TRINITY_DN7754_c0_g1_i1:97-1308(-)